MLFLELYSSPRQAGGPAQRARFILPPRILPLAGYSGWLRWKARPRSLASYTRCRQTLQPFGEVVFARYPNPFMLHTSFFLIFCHVHFPFLSSAIGVLALVRIEAQHRWYVEVLG